jgi:hypothetical protein
LTEGFKICPTCDTPARSSATVCKNCGGSLVNVPVIPISASPKRQPDRLEYDYRYGETDLYEGNLRPAAQTYSTIILAGIATLLFLLLAAVFGPSLAQQMATVLPLPASTTPRPTLSLATVTPAPPTITPSATDLPTNTATTTPTPEPCIRTVQTGDTMISLILSCGHTTTGDLLDQVLEDNDIDNAGLLQLGQTVVIPWPTPTPDPNAQITPTVEGASAAEGEVVAIATDPFSLAALTTPTLPPGVMWHIVQPDETILSIAYVYGANLEILSQLNPQITFSQCDMGKDNGGPTCTVSLSIGQQVRVPAPTPTPTLPPTPSGSETPTPSPSPTFNAPSAQSPGNLAHFQSDELVTLRWVGSAMLAPGQVYRVTVRNETLDQGFTSDTTEIHFIIPTAWQATDGQRHTYSWSISTIDLNNPDTPLYTTETRTFTWQGRGG